MLGRIFPTLFLLPLRNLYHPKTPQTSAKVISITVSRGYDKAQRAERPQIL